MSKHSSMIGAKSSPAAQSVQSSAKRRGNDGNCERRNRRQPLVKHPVECDKVEQSIRKRLVRQSNRNSDIFVTDLTDFPEQLSKAIRLLSGGAEEINVYGIDLGVSRAINLALQVTEQFSAAYASDPRTVSIELNPAHPDDPGAELHADLPRFNPGIRIRIYRKTETS